jgi:L-cystine uptake protein TcyP (sodium:dicarboxylate symporter family)
MERLNYLNIFIIFINFMSIFISSICIFYSLNQGLWRILFIAIFMGAILGAVWQLILRKASHRFWTCWR